MAFVGHLPITRQVALAAHIISLARSRLFQVHRACGDHDSPTARRQTLESWPPSTPDRSKAVPCRPPTFSGHRQHRPTRGLHRYGKKKCFQLRGCPKRCIDRPHPVSQWASANRAWLSSPIPSSQSRLNSGRLPLRSSSNVQLHQNQGSPVECSVDRQVHVNLCRTSFLLRRFRYSARPVWTRQCSMPRRL